MEIKHNPSNPKPDRSMTAVAYLMLALIVLIVILGTTFGIPFLLSLAGT